MTPESLDSIDEEQTTSSEVNRDETNDSLVDASFGDSQIAETQDIKEKAELFDAMMKGDRVAIEWDGEDLDEGAFAYRVNIEKAILPHVKSVGECAFFQCSHLYLIDMPVVEKIGRLAFAQAGSLTTLILGNKNQVVSLDEDAFVMALHVNGEQDAYFNPNGDKDGFIYVPDSLVDAYKTSDDWADYADQIKPLSEINY